MAATKSIQIRDEFVNLQSPKSIAEFSTELKKFILQNNLYTGIQNKNYVHVEGWQFAGASLGIFPIVEKVENLSGEFGPIKYRAEVKLIRLDTGETVGYGVAVCSTQESKKKNFDEYAIASMAQTRAVGKAFRLSIGWIMKLAGYEATTAEEMSGVTSESSVDTTEIPEMPISDLRFLVDTKLSAMEAPEKMKFLKDNVGTITEKNLTDEQYRDLYKELNKSEAN